MEREIQGVVQVMVEVCAGADEKVDQAALHQLDDAAAETGGRQGTGDREGNRRVMIGKQHLVREDAARFAKPRGIEGLEPFINQVMNVRAALRTIVPNRLS